MQHVDGLLEFGHLEGAIFAVHMHPNLDDSNPDSWNRLPIDGRTSGLDQAQLIAEFATRRLGEAPQAVAAVSQPLDWLSTATHSTRLYIIFIFCRSEPSSTDSRVRDAPPGGSAAGGRGCLPAIGLAFHRYSLDTIIHNFYIL